MADKGLLIYGLSDSDARICRETLESALGEAIDVISASMRDHETVRSVLESAGDRETHTGKETRFIMFLGFNNEEIGRALNGFPTLDSPRPIFCTLTENNLEWTISSLAEHLKEEDARMRGTDRA